MSQHALLRSVKGLGIPGTARKEDRKTKLKVAAPVPAASRKTLMAETDGRDEAARTISRFATACVAPACT